MDGWSGLTALVLTPAFTLWATPTSWLEVLAFALAVLMVVCNIRVVHWAWPLAAASALLYFVLFWEYRLYGEGSLQIYFALVAMWGWWQWLRARGGDGAPLRVRRLSRRRRWQALAVLALLWPALGLFLARYTDSDVPWWDALPTAGSVIGQVLLGRKFVENWPTWIMVNIVSVGLFAYKGLWLTVLLYLLFIVLAWVGWRAWQRLADEASAQGRQARVQP